jgi:hypothetical protein
VLVLKGTTVAQRILALNAQLLVPHAPRLLYARLAWIPT